MQLFKTLKLTPGIIAFVGAGGKTTTILTLAQELLQQGKRIIITTTTHIFPPDEAQYGLFFTPDSALLPKFLQTHRIAVVANSLNTQGKLTGITSEQIDLLAQLADYVLVEADGSKRLPCKVPAAHEPALPQNTTQIVGILGLSALEQRFSDGCFRAELACKHLHTLPNDTILPQHLAAIASASWGLAKNIGNRPFGILLNQRDCCHPQITTEIAQQIKQQGVFHVVSAALNDQEWNEV